MFKQLASNVSDFAGLMSCCIYLNMSQAHEILVFIISLFRNEG